MKNLFKTFLLILFLQVCSRLFAQAPIFNSFPSAQAVLLLDFDGHTVNGTSWNYNGPIECGPSNLNNQQIKEIFNRVAEDYHPFNMNVTTDEAKYLAAPSTKRMRAILTTSNGWYGNSAGGVAFVNSFSWGDNTPCFIFTSLLNFNIKNISEATAHEAGHTLGLRHQSSYDTNCLKTAEYNGGSGIGRNSWAPIMGVGYYKNSTTWYNGPNPYGCTNVQSDVDVITSVTNGISFRTDDFEQTFDNSTTQTFVNNRSIISGTISTSTDKDMFNVTLLSPQRLVIHVTPTSVGTGDAGANLDIQVELYNTSKTLIGTYNSETTLSAAIDTILDPGAYYILIDGVGNEFTRNYGSLGSYSIEAIQNPLVTLPLQKFELKGSVSGHEHKLAWLIKADEMVIKQVLEVSKNGQDFYGIAEPAINERNYQYSPGAGGPLQYRVNVTFDNGRQFYSNLVSLPVHGVYSHPKLVKNIIRDNSLLLTSQAACAYVIADVNGRIIARGMLMPGASTIKINHISSGVYFIHFTSDQKQHAKKFVKE